MGFEEGIRISRISIQNLGPLVESSFNLGKYNLIYGRNESGKTFLVEFLLRSLFKHARDWPLREIPGTGKVIVEGLDSSEVEFSPVAESTLEDYWQQDQLGMPTNIARLLVVKGGELDLDDQAKGGVDRRVLKSILSSEELLDALLDSMQKTVREAKLVDGEIIGAQRGEISDRADLEKELETLDRVIQQVQQRFSGARVKQLEQHQTNLENQLESMRRAKRHRAFQIEVELEAIEKERSQIPMDQIREIRERLHDHHHLEERIEELEKRAAEVAEKARNFPWLVQSVQLWDSLNLQRSVPASSWWLYGGLSGIVLGIISLGLGGFVQAVVELQSILLIVSLVFFLLGFGVLSFYFLRMRHGLSQAIQSTEKTAIETEFESRFGRELTGLADLKATMEMEREAHSRTDHLEEDITQLKTELAAKRGLIEREFLAFFGEPVAEDEWSQALQRAEGEYEALAENHRRLELELERLSVSPADRRQEPAGVDFDPDKLEGLQNELQENKAELQSAREDLEGLKGEIIRHTGDLVTDPWESVLANLWRQRSALADKLRRLTSRILAQMAVTHVLKELMAKEDEKIRTGLADPLVCDTLRALTGQYNKVSLREGQLIVSSDMSDYRLTELSTGAREQILLALRLGFARRLASGSPLFLLFDDAFQHSDWQRRHWLVDQTIELAVQGWQVTYLTMDDHLRELITQKGQESFGDEFTAIELG